LARLERLTTIESSYNHLHKLEDEIGFFIPPLQFYSLCEGFIDISDFQLILKDFSIDGYAAVRKENLSEFCRKTPPVGINKIVKKILLIFLNPSRHNLRVLTKF